MSGRTARSRIEGIMRRLLLTENTTADGRVEMLDEWFDPSPTGDASDVQDELERLAATSDAVLLGRQTFEDFRGYWPHHTDEPAGAHLDRVHKYVVSSTMTDPQWRNSSILPGDPVTEVRRLKGTQGGDITLTGSITLAHAVLAAGLVDEIRLFVFPAVQGRGKGLVAEGASLPELELIESKTFRSGVVLLRYASTGG
ncbi:dihydrofolate reductase family protein [Janibacter alittae]|uniref:Dihydrofolate reductase family protein n=1 Tax=Janibacter alittae TaxID=3115209 RepID=A0ABZ2MGY8_9MICO